MGRATPGAKIVVKVNMSPDLDGQNAEVELYGLGAEKPLATDSAKVSGRFVRGEFVLPGGDACPDKVYAIARVGTALGRSKVIAVTKG